MNKMNSLISLAYLKANDNPLHVFCQYIRYLLLKSPNQQLRADELKIEKTDGDLEQMDEAVVANSLEEYNRLDKLLLTNENESLKKR